MPKGSKAKTKLGRNELIIALVVLTLSLVGLFISLRSQPPTVEVNGHTFKVQVADTSSARRTGLSGQEALDEDEGMIFIFFENDIHSFWMKDMLFSIDIIWIDENYRVVHIEENVSPSTYPESFAPTVESRYVLEVYTGQVEAKDISLGDEVIFNR